MIEVKTVTAAEIEEMSDESFIRQYCYKPAAFDEVLLARLLRLEQLGDLKVSFATWNILANSHSLDSPTLNVVTEICELLTKDLSYKYILRTTHPIPEDWIESGDEIVVGGTVIEFLDDNIDWRLITANPQSFDPLVPRIDIKVAVDKATKTIHISSSYHSTLSIWTDKGDFDDVGSTIYYDDGISKFVVADHIRSKDLARKLMNGANNPSFYINPLMIEEE